MPLWLRNLSNVPNLLMANWLRRRGWVVFYLDEQARTCNKGTCWLELYKAGMKKQCDGWATINGPFGKKRN
jgi:hypothetical protein